MLYKWNTGGAYIQYFLISNVRTRSQAVCRRHGPRVADQRTATSDPGVVEQRPLPWVFCDVIDVTSAYDVWEASSESWGHENQQNQCRPHLAAGNLVRCAALIDRLVLFIQVLVYGWVELYISLWLGK